VAPVAGRASIGATSDAAVFFPRGVRAGFALASRALPWPFLPSSVFEGRAEAVVDCFVVDRFVVACLVVACLVVASFVVP
jgi:hypothetical protein